MLSFPRIGAGKRRKTERRDPNMGGPLEGVRVLDLTQLLPGPYCTCILADFGAEVIKVEPPTGDHGRMFDALFHQVNRNKKSVTLNLKDAAAQEIFRRLAERADVVVEGFRPGTTARLGVDYETLKAINPRIIYCSISGFGQDGPYRDRPGHDINYMSLGGALSLLKDGQGRPIEPGLEMADVTAGLEAAIAILAALLARDRTGKGQFIDISMLDCVVSILPMHASAFFAFGKVPPTNMTDLCPHYRIFDTADGDYLVLGIVHEDWFWANLCDLLEGFEDLRGLKHLQRIERRDEIIGRLSEAFRKKTLGEWLRELEGRDIPFSTVNDMAQVFEDPQVRHRDMLITVKGPEGERKAVGSPYKMSETRFTVGSGAPALGEHTVALLEELGISPREIEELRSRGAL
jgi:crotonobetainyl-CoA:carnitine CoA-transferase CaiB-like acyl-CoA transferase